MITSIKFEKKCRLITVDVQLVDVQLCSISYQIHLMFEEEGPDGLCHGGRRVREADSRPEDLHHQGAAGSTTARRGLETNLAEICVII